MTEVAGDEETISNIANFIESTKPEKPSQPAASPGGERVLSGADLAKQIASIKNKVTLQQQKVAALHKLPPQVSAPPRRISGFAGISISKVSKPNDDIKDKSEDNNDANTKTAEKISLSSSSIDVNTTKTIPVKNTSKNVSLPSSISLSKPSTNSDPKPSSMSSSCSRSSSTSASTVKKIPAGVSVQKAVADHREEKFKIKPQILPDNAVSLTDMSELVYKLNTDPSLHVLVLKHMSSDSIRNLSDSVTALQISGESVCSDEESLSLFFSVVNIINLNTRLEQFESDQYQPLTNLSCRSSHFSSLVKLVSKEPNLKGSISSQLGSDNFAKFESFVGEMERQDPLFYTSNIEESVRIYHKLRNISQLCSQQAKGCLHQDEAHV